MGIKYYPTISEIDEWIEALWKDAENTQYKTETEEINIFETYMYPFQAANANKFIKFTAEGMDDFYVYFQPVIKGPAPLIVHTPGYGAEISYHTEMVAEGFNVLHIQPLGYTSPKGKDESKLKNGFWPVLPDTIKTGAKGGYRTWLLNCLMAIDWAFKQPNVLPDRVSFFGTSQGGGGSLLLGSVFKDRGIRAVAADQPFMINFPLANFEGAYAMAKPAFDSMENKEEAWKALGHIDILSHAHRLDCPVLLTSGTADVACFPKIIESLIPKLTGTKSYSCFKDMPHSYNREFLLLASAWFRMYA